MKKIVIIKTVNMVNNVDNRPNTYLNQENRVCEDGVFTEQLVSTQAAVEEDGVCRDLRTNQPIDTKGKRVERAQPGTVFSYPDGYKALVPRFCNGKVAVLTTFVVSAASMHIVNVM